MALNSNYHYTPLPLHYLAPLFPSPTLPQTLLLLLLLLLGAVSMATTTRDRSVYKVKLAEQAERYEEMVEFMEQVAVAAASEGEAELSAEERNLLSVAYKNVIGARRASWRIVSSIEQKEEGRGNHAHADAIRAYRTRIESELASICGGILRLHLRRQPPLRRRPRIQGLLPQDAGRLPPLPRRVPDRLRPQGRRRAHPHRLQGRPGPVGLGLGFWI